MPLCLTNYIEVISRETILKGPLSYYLFIYFYLKSLGVWNDVLSS